MQIEDSAEDGGNRTKTSPSGLRGLLFGNHDLADGLRGADEVHAGREGARVVRAGLQTNHLAAGDIGQRDFRLQIADWRLQIEDARMRVACGLELEACGFRIEAKNSGTHRWSSLATCR